MTKIHKFTSNLIKTHETILKFKNLVNYKITCSSGKEEES